MYTTNTYRAVEKNSLYHIDSLEAQLNENMFLQNPQKEEKDPAVFVLTKVLKAIGGGLKTS